MEQPYRVNALIIKIVGMLPGASAEYTSPSMNVKPIKKYRLQFTSISQKYLIFAGMNPLKKISTLFKLLRQERQYRLRLEFVLTDYCNLNCKGCTHYAPVAPKEFEELELLRQEMSHLGNVCGSEVRECYLIGGETLLYPHLTEAMTMLRRYFPTQKLSIFTNGLLIPRMSDEFWQLARELDFHVVITIYPVKADYEAIIALCKEKGVKTEVYGDRSQQDSFFRFPLSPVKLRHNRKIHLSCFNRGCMSVIGGYIYPCSISGCVSHLNRAFGTDFRHEEGDRLKVSEIGSAKEILRLYTRPVPFCGYCRKYQPADYGISRREASEWIDEE